MRSEMPHLSIAPGSAVHREEEPAWIPEHEMWMAVVFRAIADAKGNEQEARRSAIAWFLSRSKDVLSFRWVMDHFPAADRKRVLAFVFDTEKKLTVASKNAGGPRGGSRTDLVRKNAA